MQAFKLLLQLLSLALDALRRRLLFQTQQCQLQSPLQTLVLRNHRTPQTHFEFIEPLCLLLQTAAGMPQQTTHGRKLSL